MDLYKILCQVVLKIIIIILINLLFIFKAKNEVKKEVKNDNIASLAESVSKLYIAPTKPKKSYDFGISTYYDQKFKVCTN